MPKKMTPLKQFVCDTCHQVIESPDQGWLQWLEASGKPASSFRICHQLGFSPLGAPHNCARHDGKPGLADVALDSVLECRIPHLLYFVDLGVYHDPERKRQAPDLREWAELVRRLTIPYYEEARLYWQKAIKDGYFEGANEIVIYSKDFLTELIDKYRDA